MDGLLDGAINSVVSEVSGEPQTEVNPQSATLHTGNSAERSERTTGVASRPSHNDEAELHTVLKHASNTADTAAASPSTAMPDHHAGHSQTSDEPDTVKPKGSRWDKLVMEPPQGLNVKAATHQLLNISEQAAHTRESSSSIADLQAGYSALNTESTQDLTATGVPTDLQSTEGTHPVVATATANTAGIPSTATLPSSLSSTEAELEAPADSTEILQQPPALPSPTLSNATHQTGVPSNASSSLQPYPEHHEPPQSSLQPAPVDVPTETHLAFHHHADSSMLPAHQEETAHLHTHKLPPYSPSAAEASAAGAQRPGCKDQLAAQVVAGTAAEAPLQTMPSRSGTQPARLSSTSDGVGQQFSSISSPHSTAAAIADDNRLLHVPVAAMTQLDASHEELLSAEEHIARLSSLLKDAHATFAMLQDHTNPSAPAPTPDAQNCTYTTAAPSVDQPAHTDPTTVKEAAGHGAVDASSVVPAGYGTSIDDTHGSNGSAWPQLVGLMSDVIADVQGELELVRGQLTTARAHLHQSRQQLLTRTTHIARACQATRHMRQQ